jgi:hypothetical protein
MGTAFMGYVLPYGQMSHWGAVVITNLITAIPWIGQDIVDFILGGFLKLLIEEPYNSNVVMKILFVAGISPTLEVIYDWNLLLSSIQIVPTVKIMTTRGWSAGVRFKSTCFEASQRLNAGDPVFPYIVGLVEGDGFFILSKAGKYISYELGMELSIKDVQLIYKIRDILGIGIVSFRERKGVKMVCLRIRNKSHLINYILPIFDKYPMLSNKQYDYLRFREALLSNITFFADLPKYTRPSGISTMDEKSVLSVPYFSAWLVGFVEAEGCFSLYKHTKTGYPIASFDISQTNGEVVIKAIRKYLSFTASVYGDNTSNYRIKGTSVRSVENVIKFIQKAPVKLLGNKKLQYILWIKELRTIPRYAEKIKIPTNY